MNASDYLRALDIASGHTGTLEEALDLALGLAEWALQQSDECPATKLDDDAYKAIKGDAE